MEKKLKIIIGVLSAVILVLAGVLIAQLSKKTEIKETVQEPAEPVKKVTSGITIPMGKSKTTRAVAKTFYLDADSHEKLLGWMEKYNQSASRIINELIRQVDL